MIPRILSRCPGPGVLVLALLVLLVGACEEGTLNEPTVSDDTFRSYVALGNSLTAGFQANGIVDSTQRASYAALLADQMGTRFGQPLLEPPGCPPPVQNLLLLPITGGPSGPSCSLRSSPSPSTLHNVAVPGAKVIDALTNTDPESSPNALTSFILGGRTQVQAALEANPTFASVWLGNNDALGAALAGDPSRLTPEEDVAAQLTQVVDSLEGGGVERGVLLGVADPTVLPNLSTGAAYAAAESQINQFGQSIASESTQLRWGGFTVDESCTSAPGAQTRVPFSYGFFNSNPDTEPGLVQRAFAGGSPTLDCDPSTAADPVLTPDEQTVIVNRVQAFNDAISDLAAERGWAYVDVNPALRALYRANAGNDDPSDDLVPKFPNPPTTFDDPADNPPTFGRYFSEDGVHPSSPTHRVVAHLVVERLNTAYDDISLEPISIPSEIDDLLGE